MSDKIIKAGTKVMLYSTCQYVGCDESEEYILNGDMTEDELNELAYEQAMENIQPEGWFEIIEEDEDEA